MAADVRAFDVATGNVPNAPGEARYGEHLEGHPRESRSPAGEARDLPQADEIRPGPGDSSSVDPAPAVAEPAGANDPVARNGESVDIMREWRDYNPVA